MISHRRKVDRSARNLISSSPPGDEMACALRRAIENNEVWPAFQPLVDLKSGAIVGFEVLARWTDATGSAVAPSTFIPIAERDDLINALTARIVFNACRQAAIWLGSFVLAINISPKQFRDPTLSASLTKTVEASGFPLNRIHIEITESALLENEEVVRSNIWAIKSSGMGLALDDFGTGFASLTTFLSTSSKST